MSEWLLKKINWFTGCIAVAFLFGLIALAANIEIKDIDLWLHLAVGKYIVTNFSIPKVDILSCTFLNAPWVNHEWLFQTIVYSVYNAAGFDGLVSLKVCVVFLTFVLLLFLGYTREFHIGPIVILLLVLLVYQLRLTLRPDIFSIIFFILYATIPISKRWTLWVIALIQIVWTNMHGFFVLGPFIILISLAGEWAKRHIALPFEWNKIGCLSDEEYKGLKQILFISVLACFVNPHFVKGVMYPLGVLFSIGGESKIFFQHIQELQRPLQWGTLFSLQPFFHYKLLILVSFFGFVFNRRKIDISALAMWLIFLCFSLFAIRNIVFFAVAAYFAFLANFRHISIREFLPAQFRNVKFRLACSVALKVFLIAWIANYANQLLLRGYYDFDKFERKSEYSGVSQRNFPHKAADFLVDNKVKGNFFNDFNSGAYLLGRTFPDIKVFIDGRTEVYGADHFKLYREIWEGDRELISEATDRYHLTGAFLNSVYVPAPAKVIHSLYTSKDWVLVYFDYDATIFLRNIPENQQWISDYQIDLAQWQTSKAELLKIGAQNVTPYRYVSRAYALLNMGFGLKAEREAVEALRIESYNTKAHKLLGRIYNERKEYDAAFEHLRQAKLTDPNDMRVRYQMAIALYYLGEIETAKEQCQVILDRSPRNSKGLFLLSLIYAKEHKYNEMMTALQKALQVDSSDIKGLLKVGNLLIDQEAMNQAKDVFVMALEIDSENEEIKKKFNLIP